MTTETVVDDPLAEPIAIAFWDNVSSLGWENASEPVREMCREDARKLLAAIAATGRLLPEGGEVRVEWGNEVTEPGEHVGAGIYLPDDMWIDKAQLPGEAPWDRDRAEHELGRSRWRTLVRRTVTEWPDGQTHTGPWEAAS